MLSSAARQTRCTASLLLKECRPVKLARPVHINGTCGCIGVLLLSALRAGCNSQQPCRIMLYRQLRHVQPAPERQISGSAIKGFKMWDEGSPYTRILIWDSPVPTWPTFICLLFCPAKRLNKRSTFFSSSSCRTSPVYKAIMIPVWKPVCTCQEPLNP